MTTTPEIHITNILDRVEEDAREWAVEYLETDATFSPATAVERSKVLCDDALREFKETGEDADLEYLIAELVALRALREVEAEQHKPQRYLAGMPLVRRYSNSIVPLPGDRKRIADWVAASFTPVVDPAAARRTVFDMQGIDFWDWSPSWQRIQNKINELDAKRVAIQVAYDVRRA